MVSAAARARSAVQMTRWHRAVIGSPPVGWRRGSTARAGMLQTGDPDGALAAAAGWDPGAMPGRPRNPAALAQIQAGAAIAHLAKDALDGAAEQVAPVLELPPEFRITTVTGWLADLGRRLSASRYARSPIAVGLRQQIRDFTTTTPVTRSAKDEER